MSDVQELVDALASDIGRPVGVDDRQFRAVAYSSHADGIDPVRTASILHREAPREVTQWLESLGVRETAGLVRVPAHTGFRMASRICMPIRFDDTLLGYLWLIDEPVPLDAAELAASARCTVDLGVALYRAMRLEDEDREHEHDLLGRLLGGRDGDPAAAAEALLGDRALAPAPAYAVLALQAFHDAGDPMPDGIRVRLAAAAEQARRGAAPHHLLVYITGELAICVLACHGEAEIERRGAALADAAAQSLADWSGWSPLVGIGDSRTAVRALAESRREAERALHVAAAVGTAGPVVRWSQLGAYRTIADLLGRRDPLELVPAALTALLRSADATALVPTLECYLDLGGDARAAAEALFVHRSSLYGRLHRIEEVTGVNLGSGEDRLELHLGLRLWRMGGGGFSS